MPPVSPIAGTRVVFLTFIVTIACGSQKETPPEPAKGARVSVGMVQWNASPDATDVPSNEAEFRALLERDVLAGLPRLETATGSLRMVISAALDSSGGEGVLIIDARVKGRGLRVPIEVGLAATGPVKGSGAKSMLSKGLSDLKAALISQFRVYDGGRKAWLRALDSAEPDEQILAIGLLADDKALEAVVPIAKLLVDPRLPVAEAAAEGLAALGDGKAVPLLIDSIKRGDLRSETRAIEAMAQIGGAEARAYLEMTANGHEVPEVRRLSTDALSRMR